ncbi:MAG TPA: hypothetical protein VHS78_16175, partial [Candidatus Elarobacter sp.]|nr:hypothetical protein [Candidatus Elarobacter sp.]
PFRTHTPGRELRTFLMHQFLLLIIAAASTVLAALRIMSVLVPQISVPVSAQHIHQMYVSLILNSPLILLDVVWLIILFIYIRKQISQADEAIHRLTLNWLRYEENRKFWDEEYLRTKGYHVPPFEPNPFGN